MAIILPPGKQIFDANGVTVSGGKFRVYTANTTTLASLYSDNSLSTPRANPVVANAAGELPFFFLASGTYDVAELTSADVLLNSAEDVPAWGEDTGDLNRTLSGLARLEFTGSAGDAIIRAKPPSPDETGGSLTIEGAAGTQLDSLTIDAAATDFSGDVTVKGGKKLLGVVQTDATTFTAVSSVDISLVESPTGVRAWRVDLFDMTTTEAGGDAMLARLSYDNGATYKSGAADYDYVTTLTVAASVTAAGSTGATSFVLAPGFETGLANTAAHVEILVITPLSGSDATNIEAVGAYTDPGSTAPAFSRIYARGLGGYGPATHLRVLAPAGSTITGKYRLTPLYGFGE